AESREKSPARRGQEMLKEAQARLMTGDRPAADAIFKKYLELAQPSQPRLAAFEEAQWEFLTGRRRSGMARLEKVIPAFDGDQQSLALSQLSLWKSETGSAREAAELAGRAAALARGNTTRNLSAVCRAIASPPQGTSGSRVADAYALLFAKKYAEALPLLEE